MDLEANILSLLVLELLKELVERRCLNFYGTSDDLIETLCSQHQLLPEVHEENVQDVRNLDASH